MFHKLHLVLIGLFFVCAGQVLASPAGNEIRNLKSLGNVKAKAGGTIYLVLNSEPPTLNPFSSTDVYASLIQDHVIDTMMFRNQETYAWEPGLAESYEEGEGGMSYTFKIRKGAVFSDGAPVTAKDVKFSFDAVRDPAYKAARVMPYFENIKSAEVLDKSTVRFHIKKRYFNNFNVLAGMMLIVPQKHYRDPKKKMNKKLIGSGPYVIEKYNKGRSIILKKNKKWWGWSVSHFKGKYKPEKMFYRIIKGDDLQLEKLKKSELDVLGMSPEMYVQKTKGKPFGDSVFKQKVKNKQPKGYGFVGWNFKKKKFQDKNVRVALAHLMNRKLMNQKFRFGMSLLATGPWYKQSPYADKSIKPIGFNPKKAAKLLAKSGWSDSDKNGVLDKTVAGKKKEFRFTLLLPSRDAEKYFTVYKEDLKKAGIDMTIKLVEWNSFLKSLDEKTFDAVTLAWSGGSVDNDPKQIWHSESTRAGGSNFISYKNPEVDKLIDLGRQEIDKAKRINIYKKIYRKIAEDAPYAFMFNSEYILYGHTKRMKMKKKTHHYAMGREYWWIEKP